MIEKFQAIESRFVDIERKMSDPEIISDNATYQDLVKQHSELKEGVEVFRQYQKASSELIEAEALLQDPEMKEVAEEEMSRLKTLKNNFKEQLEFFLLPKDPDDSKNAIVEIRSGSGGEEAALFAGTLYRMYSRYTEKNKWKVEVLSENFTGLGGLKEVTYVISGKNVFSRLKYESGTHRVQRVPETESSGRVHTSAVTVAIFPEAEEVDIDIDTKDLRIDTFRASGAGGQHVNKTSSAIRITHIPTGTVAACQDERSQFQNKDKAMRMLRSRLYEAEQERKAKDEALVRKIQVGSGDRSEKIRTYNFPQKRVTDHRVPITLHTLDKILDGDLDELLDALAQADRVSKLSEQ
ncbi:MAG: peptide chain release factor 1 [Candidatus Margulisbacteria bacterium]|nr:peptide chain release factor 1 [Candidatus Margulisiibacteriota bacterium]